MSGAQSFRIGVDVREWHAGTSTGIARILSGLLGWAAHETRHEFILIGNQHTEFRVTGERVTTRVATESNRLLWDQRALPRLLHEENVQVVLSPYYKGPLRSPCPVVVTANDLIELHFPGGGLAKRWILPFWIRLMLRSATHVLTLSEFSRREIVDRLGVPAEHVSTFPPAVDDRFIAPTSGDARHRVRTRYGLPDDYVLYIGRAAPHKNVPTLIRGWGRLPAELRKRFTLVLAGSDAELLGKAAARDGVDALTTGLVDDGDLPTVYGGARLMCYPSLHEGFGLPPLEAMACGTAVIAADASAIPEVVGDAAVLVDPLDPDAWSSALASLLADHEARAKLVRKGAAHARQYTQERSARAMLASLVAAASGKRT